MEYNAKYDLTPAQIEAMTVIKEVRIYRNGLEIVRGMRFPTPKPTPPKQKGIFEMSRKSKLRMAHLVANSEVKWRSLLTLTYGDFFVPKDGRELKRQLNVFLKSFRNRFDGEYFWFMEFTKKDKPHLHILTTVAPNQFDSMWLAERWAKITVYDVWKDHRDNAITIGDTREIPIPIEYMEDEMKKVTRVHLHKKTWDKIHKPNGAIRYMLKYAAKSEQKLVPVQFGHCGRFWGCSRGVEAHLEMTLHVGEDITQEQLEDIFAKVLPNDLPLFPRYFFLTDIISKLSGMGISLKELNAKFKPSGDGDSQPNVIE